MRSEPTGRDRSARWARLLALLAERGRLDVKSAAAELGVSEATVRRDFGALADEQLVARTHGGILATSVAYELPARYRVGPTTGGAKERIAEAVAELVPADAIVGLNGGTTTTAIARSLARRSDLIGTNRSAPLTVVTNALNIATELVLRPHIRCLSLGGMVRPESYEVTGPLAISIMEQLWLNVAVIGVNALSADGGATCRFEDEAGVSRLMTERADRVVVATEGHKIGPTAFARICSIARIHTVVTDASVDSLDAERLRRAGVQVIVV